MFKRTVILTVFMFLCIATYAEATQIVRGDVKDEETVIFNEEYAGTPQERIVAIQLLLASFDIWRNSAGNWTDVLEMAKQINQ